LPTVSAIQSEKDDGKQRFDIVLAPKRTERLEDDPPTDLSGSVAICKAKFVPISGYRPDHPGIKFMRQTEDIEVWLAALSGTPLHLPYRIYVSTSLGRGSISLIEIKARVAG
jgi:hypothetical protein